MKAEWVNVDMLAFWREYLNSFLVRPDEKALHDSDVFISRHAAFPAEANVNPLLSVLFDRSGYDNSQAVEALISFAVRERQVTMPIHR